MSAKIEEIKQESKQINQAISLSMRSNKFFNENYQMKWFGSVYLSNSNLIVSIKTTNNRI